MNREHVLNYMKIAGGLLLGLTALVAVEAVSYAPFGLYGLLNDTPENRQKAHDLLNQVLNTPGAKIICRNTDNASTVDLSFLRRPNSVNSKGRTMLEDQLRNGWCQAHLPEAKP